MAFSHKSFFSAVPHRSFHFKRIRCGFRQIRFHVSFLRTFFPSPCTAVSRKAFLQRFPTGPFSRRFPTGPAPFCFRSGFPQLFFTAVARMPFFTEVVHKRLFIALSHGLFFTADSHKSFPFFSFATVSHKSFFSQRFPTSPSSRGSSVSPWALRGSSVNPWALRGSSVIAWALKGKVGESLGSERGDR